MKNIVVLLDNIRSIYNVGSVFRTSDACGISKIILCGITATPEHPKVAKTALGAEKNIEWEYEKSSLEAITKFKLLGYKIYSIEITNNAVDFRSIKYEDNTLLILGHEVDGIPNEIIELSDKVIKIPMIGIKESLNVSTAFGIVAYEAMRDTI